MPDGPNSLGLRAYYCLEEMKAVARRPLPLRWRYAFIHTYKPVLDDASFRAFDTMEDYRRWCEQNLPDWLGYARI